MKKIYLGLWLFAWLIAFSNIVEAEEDGAKVVQKIEQVEKYDITKVRVIKTDYKALEEYLARVAPAIKKQLLRIQRLYDSNCPDIEKELLRIHEMEMEEIKAERFFSKYQSTNNLFLH